MVWRNGQSGTANVQKVKRKSEPIRHSIVSQSHKRKRTSVLLQTATT